MSTRVGCGLTTMLQVTYKLNGSGAKCTGGAPNARGGRRMHFWSAECTRGAPNAPRGRRTHRQGAKRTGSKNRCKCEGLKNRLQEPLMSFRRCPCACTCPAIHLVICHPGSNMQAKDPPDQIKSTFSINLPSLGDFESAITME